MTHEQQFRIFWYLCHRPLMCERKRESVCVHIHAYTCIYIYIYTHACIHTYTCMHTHSLSLSLSHIPRRKQAVSFACVLRLFSLSLRSLFSPTVHTTPAQKKKTDNPGARRLWYARLNVVYLRLLLLGTRLWYSRINVVCLRLRSLFPWSL